MTRRPRELWESERLVTDLVGRLIEFWGFKRNMGRVWAVLYLSTEPLTAHDVRTALKLSTGAVSMTLNELARWGVVKKVWVPGERKDYFSAETQIWKMVSRVMAEREGGEISHAMEVCEEALRLLTVRAGSASGEDRERVALQRGRIAALLGVAKLGKSLLDGLLSTAKVDAEPLSRVELR